VRPKRLPGGDTGRRSRLRVLVTGGAGYIGSHTAKKLAESGFEPVTLDNLSTGHRWAVQWGTFVQGDLADRELLRQVLEKYRIEAVMHFAASAYVGESMGNPRKYFANNIANSLHLLEAMQDTGVDRIVFSSSCATYGHPNSVPISENHVQQPINPYGESKLFVERALHWYGQAYGVQWVSLRYFNAAGADPEGELGEVHVPETHLVPLTIRAALEGSCLDIFGFDYPTPDGTAVRDFIHVMDLADAHVRALQYLLDGERSRAFNLGSGEGRSILEIVETVERVAGRPVPLRMTARRPGDPAVLVADSSSAAAVLRWQPRLSDPQIVVDTALKWYARMNKVQALPAAH